MFKQVQGDELSSFDPETIALFRRRESNPQTTIELMQIPRRARQHLPIFVDKEKNKEVVAWEAGHSAFWWKLLLGFGAFAWAANDYSKMYYPYGIIARRSIPISWLTFARQRVPMASVFLFAWYEKNIIDH